MRFDRESFASLFAMPQPDAARKLGICLTSFKRACRKLGLIRWPYSRKKNDGHEPVSSVVVEGHHSSLTVHREMQSCLPPRAEMPIEGASSALLSHSQLEIPGTIAYDHTERPVPPSREGLSSINPLWLVQGEPLEYDEDFDKFLHDLGKLPMPQAWQEMIPRLD